MGKIEKAEPLEIDYLIPGSEDDIRHYAQDSIVYIAETLRIKHGVQQPYEYLAEIATGIATQQYDKGQED